MVGPSFSGMEEWVNGFAESLETQVQIIDEAAIIQAQRIDPYIPNTDDYRYGLISTIVRSHLIKGLSVIAICDNLSVEALVLWKKIASEHNTKCIAVMYKADQEDAIKRANDMINLPQDGKAKVIDEIKKQFKKMDELKKLLDPSCLLGKDLVDKIYKSEDLSEDI